jgi:hypothetical protein
MPRPVRLDAGFGSKIRALLCIRQSPKHCGDSDIVGSGIPDRLSAYDDRNSRNNNELKPVRLIFSKLAWILEGS